MIRGSIGLDDLMSVIVDTELALDKLEKRTWL